MAIHVTCRCGRSYSLKHEFSGKTVRCPHCAEHFKVPIVAERVAQPQADPAFDRDRFLLRQKVAISEKYCVWDDEGRTILYIERPAHLMRGLLAMFGGLFAGLVVGGVFGALAALTSSIPALCAVFTLLAILGGIATVIGLLIALTPKRHVNFYRNENKGERLLEILQDHKIQFIVATYTVNDASGKLLARLRKNYLYNVFRKRWNCYAPDGATMCVAKEDSMILSLLRRFLGPLFGILRTNFVILRGDTDQVIGEFNRKFTLLDRYVLDLKADPDRSLDRRIALALGVMLDTGERR
ncbi:MAG: hypothetical protein ACYC35_18270 [Pirellulales bacterium]